MGRAALVDQTQDALRRELAVLQNDLRRRLETLRLVGAESVQDARPGCDGACQGPCVQDRLGCAVRAARIHRMGGIAQ